MLRMKPIAPLAVNHKTLKEMMLDGKRAAAGTAVLVNLYAVHYNPELWPEPEQFRPERFLGGGSCGYLEHTPRSFVPFRAGMRACAGMRWGSCRFPWSSPTLSRS